MKKMLALFVLLFGLQSHAGFIADPFLGYNTGSTKATIAASNASGSSTNSGFDYGLRAGYLFGPSFWTAVEYTGGSGKDKESTIESDYTRTALGLVFGYKYTRYNFWAGYGFSDKITYKNDSGEFSLKGTTLKIGFAVDVAKNVAVSAEYVMPKYTKYENATTSDGDISSLYSKFDMSFAVLAVTFPFGFSK